MNSEEIIDLYKDLEHQFFEKIKRVKASPDISVCILRDYNKKFNKVIGDEHPEFIDGFAIILKKRLMRLELPEIYKRAFNYI